VVGRLALALYDLRYSGSEANPKSREDPGLRPRVILGVRRVGQASRLRFHHQPMRSVLVPSVVLLLAVSTAPSATESGPAATCIYVVHHDGAQYGLPYAGRRCGREGYLILPGDRYDALASWSSNAAVWEIISAFDRYRILARLATLDERSEHGRYNVHGLFTRWSEYKWAEHTKYAYYSIRFALGDVEVVRTLFETPLLRLGLAKERDIGPASPTRIELRQRKISPTDRADLLRLLTSAEGELAKLERLRAVRRSPEEFTGTHRQTLSVFRLD